MRKTTFAPAQLLRSVHMEKKYFGKAGFPVLYNGYPASQSCPEATKTHVSSYSRQTMHRGKVDPGSVSCLGSCEQALRLVFESK